MSKFSYSNALVTGASSGIGEALARELQRRGANVILVARRADRLAQVADELNALRPGSARTIIADISTEEIENVLSLADRESIDLLVNNAGVCCAGEVGELPVDDWRWIVDVNLMGCTGNGAAHFLRPLRQQGFEVSDTPQQFSSQADRANRAAFVGAPLSQGLRLAAENPGSLARRHGRGIRKKPGNQGMVFHR